MKEAINQIVDMANKLNDTVFGQKYEDAEPILVDGPVHECKHCACEKFDVEEVTDDDDNELGTNYICQVCNQTYTNSLTF